MDLLPKDLLNDLESGDRSMEHLKADAPIEQVGTLGNGLSGIFSTFNNTEWMRNGPSSTIGNQMAQSQDQTNRMLALNQLSRMGAFNE